MISHAPDADLLRATAELVNIASVSHHEVAIADHVERLLSGVAGLEVTRIENNVVARTTWGRARRLALVGHLDTVPPAGNEQAKIDGDTLHGLGSADMKGGVAVLLALAQAQFHSSIDCTYVFYACEEVSVVHSGLRAIERERPELLEADAAVLAEPTGAQIEAGCQGVLRATVTVRGRRAHVSRPWAGLNAIHRLGGVFDRIEEFDARRPVIDGCEYHESLQAVSISGGVAGNIIPDEARILLSHRFAPDRDAVAATQALETLLAPALDGALGDDFVVQESAPAALPMLDDPLLAVLVEASGLPPRAKIAWTDVAFFAERGIPAANFGPGDPLLAHAPDERVERHELETVYRSLAALISD